MNDREDDPATGRQWIRRIGRALLQILGIFVVLEPIWMLLPFAGFLYGSVLQMQTLARDPDTAWLTHFVFPVLTLGWTGPVLVLLGLGIFLVGAGQIYVSKLRRTGLVTNGLYRFVRHPQYVALVLFGVGILMTWGRAIAFIAYFAMLVLYMELARSEERRCRRLFGAAYDAYAGRTSFVIPGDRRLRGLFARLSPGPWNPLLRITTEIVVTAAIGFAAFHLILAVKRARLRVPHLAAVIRFEPAAEPVSADLRSALLDGIPWVHDGRLAVARGPYRNAAAPAYAERLLTRLRTSKTLAEPLGFLAEPGGDVAVAFSSPFDESQRERKSALDETGRGPPVDPAGPDRVRLVIFRCTLAAGATLEDALGDPALRTIRTALFVPVDLGSGEDCVVDAVRRPGPRFPGEERWRYLIERFGDRPGGRITTAGPALAPGRDPDTTLVLVKAPILRLRLDPAFAEEVRDRLRDSPAFRTRLRETGTGRDVLPVAFPRPGPGWYREHRDRPEVDVFVILVRRDPSSTLDAILEAPQPSIIGAFTARLDLSIDPPADAVTGVSVIGPRRDLGERWRFFLSGL